MFIKIVETDDAFDWSPVDDTTGAKSDTVFQLRIVNDDVDKDIRQKRTRPVLETRQRRMIPTLDEPAYIAEVLDYAIVGWSGLQSATSGQDLPCTAALKARLPEKIKAEILRLCAGKEAGDIVAQHAQEKKVSKTT